MKTEPKLSIRLDPEIERRLDDLARRTGRTKSDHAREAILHYLEELEDCYIALERLESPEPAVSLEALGHEIGLT